MHNEWVAIEQYRKLELLEIHINIDFANYSVEDELSKPVQDRYGIRSNSCLGYHRFIKMQVGIQLIKYNDI